MQESESPNNTELAGQREAQVSAVKNDEKQEKMYDNHKICIMVLILFDLILSRFSLFTE